MTKEEILKEVAGEHRWLDEVGYTEYNVDMVFASINKNIRALEPKTGHWIVKTWNNKEHHTCSVCNHVVTYEPCYHYCPYCGAKMESEE